MESSSFVEERFSQRSASSGAAIRTHNLSQSSTRSGTGLARYRKLEKLGEGTYGVVHKAEDLHTGEVSTFGDLVR